MSIQWKQTKWCNVKGERKAWAWEGARTDGRGFKIYLFPHRGYVCLTYNGKQVGVGSTLAQAQALAIAVPGAKLANAA